MHDIYIDNIMCLILGIIGKNNVAQGQATVLLAIDATAHPNHPHEPIPRECMETRDKLLAEAGLLETKVVLGRIFNFRQL